jgi:impB/mucB/samB family C-terminal domain
VTVRLRYTDWNEVSHAITRKTPTDLETDIYPLLPALLRRAWKRRTSLRLAGLRLSNVGEPVRQEELPLDDAAVRQIRRREAARLLDTMRARSLPLIRANALSSKVNR